MGLFNRFLDRFSHSSATESEVINHEWVNNFERYRDLINLQDKRQLLEVFTAGSKNSFQTMIIGIDFFTGTFSIDAFSPQLFNPESLVGQTISIRHQSHWQQLDVEATVNEWSEEDSCYSLALPIINQYQPRRNHPRIQLHSDKTLKTEINPLYGAPWYAAVKDISEGGMRIAISGDLRPHLHKDKLLPKCQIRLDNNIAVQCRGIVCAFSYYPKPSRQTEISIAYQNMSQSHLTDLRRFMSYIEVAA
jgi:c-di-GMP-binding flagellar brake protein YcgR